MAEGNGSDTKVFDIEEIRKKVNGRIDLVDLTNALRACIAEPDHTYLDREEIVFSDAIAAVKSQKTIIDIEGPLGCGKTTLVKYLARHLNIKPFLEDAEHPIICGDLGMLYSPDFETRRVGAVNINNDYLGFRMADATNIYKMAGSAVRDRRAEADDLYMDGFIEDGLMTMEEVAAVQKRRRDTLKLIQLVNPITGPKNLVIQIIGSPELFWRRKNHRGRDVEIEKDGGGVPIDYMRRLTKLYQSAPSLAVHLADEGYRGRIVYVSQEISEGVEFKPSDMRHLVPVLEAITDYVKN